MKRDYYPFGEDYTSAGSETDYQFTGKEKDNSELYYFGARYYDARIGRWLSVDPLAAEAPLMTPYHYTSNNPLNRIDPDGLFDLSAIEDDEKRRIVQQAIDNAYDKIFGDDKTTINAIYKEFGAKTDDQKAKIDGALKDMFKDGQGPAIVLGKTKDGYAGSEEETNSITIDDKSDFFKAASSDNRSYLGKVGQEGMARIMEHEPIHFLMYKNPVTGYAKVETTRGKILHEYDLPNRIQDKKYKKFNHMKELHDRLRVIKNINDRYKND